MRFQTKTNRWFYFGINTKAQPGDEVFGISLGRLYFGYYAKPKVQPKKFHLNGVSYCEVGVAELIMMKNKPIDEIRAFLHDPNAKLHPQGFAFGWLDANGVLR